MTRHVHITAMFNVFISVCIYCPTSTMGHVVRRFVGTPPRFHRPHCNGASDQGRNGRGITSCSRGRYEGRRRPMRAAMTRQLRQRGGCLVSRVVVQSVPRLIASCPFRLLVHDRPRCTIHRASNVRARNRNIHTYVPITMSVRFPLRPRFQGRTFRPCPFLATRQSMALFRPRRPCIRQ